LKFLKFDFVDFRFFLDFEESSSFEFEDVKAPIPEPQR